MKSTLYESYKTDIRNQNTEFEVKTISSREVADMMDIEHKSLLRKIEGINEDFRSAKVCHEKYWIESAFENRGRYYREYQVTKLGCEFLAHKSTGKKGNLFTDRYMTRFEEMKTLIQEQEQQPKLPTNYKEALRDLLLQVEENERKDRYIRELEPQAEYTKKVLKNNGSLLTITQIAKDYGMSGQQLNSLLYDFKVQYYQNNQWLLYSKYQGEGYVKSVQSEKENATPHTKWTQKGKKFIYELLKKKGILTVFEREEKNKIIQLKFN